MAIQIIREITADVVKRGSAKSVYAKQNDLNSRFLNVRIQDDGKNIMVDKSLTVILNVERSDKQHNMFYGTVNDDGTVKVPFTSWMLELEGTLVCDISLVAKDNSTAKLTTMQFNIFVESAVVSDESFIETDEYSVIIDLLNRAEEAADASKGAVESAKAAAESAKAVEDAAKSLQESAEEAAKFVDEKIDKVSGATIGNFAQLLADGSLSDSGVNKESVFNEAKNLAYQTVGRYDVIDASNLVTFTPDKTSINPKNDVTFSIECNLSAIPGGACICYIGGLTLNGYDLGTQYDSFKMNVYALINGIQVELSVNQYTEVNTGNIDDYMKELDFNFALLYGRPLVNTDSLTFIFEFIPNATNTGSFSFNSITGTVRYI